MKNLRTGLKDLLKRLFALLVILLLTANLTGWISRRAPDEALLYQAGFAGEIAYRNPIAKEAAAYILLDREAGTASFAVVGNSRSMGERYPLDSGAWWKRWTPLFQSVRYGSTIRTENLEPVRCYRVHDQETAAERIFCMEQDVWTNENGILDVHCLILGATLEPERLTGQNALFQRSAGHSTVFAVLEEEEEDRLASREERLSDYWENW